MEKKLYRVCYFGIYRNHPRNAIFLSVLKQSGYVVTEIVDNGTGFPKYIRLGWHLFRRRKEFDVVIVGFPGQQCAILARCVFGGPVVLNALLSLYDAVISDRKVYSKFSLRAIYFWLLDFISIRASSAVVLDCNAYIDYFVKNFSFGNIFRPSRNKFERIFFGADESVIKPISPSTEASLEIHYYSSFIPSHGVDTIIRAAKLLEEDGIRFVISGRGQSFEKDRKLADDLGVKNITFVERFKNVDELNNFINSSWVCLGLFADIPKAGRAISSKVFEAMRCSKPIITARSPASLELFTDRINVLFVNPNDPSDLADKIRLLKADDNLRKKIAAAAGELYTKKASWAVIGAQLRRLMDKLMNEYR